MVPVDGEPSMDHSIREAQITDAPAIARVHVDTWRSTYRGIVPDEVLDGLSYESRADMWRGAASEEEDRFVLVAEAESEVVGFAAAGPSRAEDLQFEGELYAIYVLEGHQGQGIGRGLMRAAGERLLAAAMASMLVWVLEENPYRQFYTELGGRAVAERQLQIGGTVLREIGYGWDDLEVAPFMRDEG